MRGEQSDLWNLAIRVRQGDASAAAAFTCEFERQLGRIIRRQAQGRKAVSEVDRRVAAAIGGLLDTADGSSIPDQTLLVEQATRRLCLATLEVIRGERNASETIVDH